MDELSPACTRSICAGVPAPMTRPCASSDTLAPLIKVDIVTVLGDTALGGLRIEKDNFSGILAVRADSRVTISVPVALDQFPAAGFMHMHIFMRQQSLTRVHTPKVEASFLDSPTSSA